MDISKFSENTTMYFFGQGFTFVAFALLWISLVMKTKKKILVVGTISQLTLALSYFLLGNINGVLNSFFNIFRNLTGIKVKDKSQKIKNIFFIILLLIIILMYALTFDGIATILIGCAAIIELIATQYCNEQTYRILMCFVCLAFIGFFIITTNIAGLICESIMLVVSIVSYIKYRKKEKEE